MLRYTEEHEWLKQDGDEVVVGITEHAAEQLGDLVFVELPAEGITVVKGEDIVTIESVKAASDIAAPLDGQVTEVNAAIVANPALVNEGFDRGIRAMAPFDRITQEPGTMGGKPCVRGLRVTVGMVVGQIGAGHTVWPISPTSSARTSCRRCAMRHGEPRSAKSSWAGHEGPRRHEPVATLGAFPRRCRIDAAHWSDLGAGDAPDVEIMAFAHGYIVFTHDLDFGAILAATDGEKPSVLQVRSEDVSPEAIGDVVVTAVRQTADELAEGALLTVEPNRMRVRLLPLRP